MDRCRVAFRSGLSALAILATGAPVLGQNPALSSPKWADAKLEFAVPADARSLGHHGTVIVEGDVSPEARTMNVTIAQSSRSAILDKLVLDKLSNAKIGSDIVKDGASKIRIEVDLYNYKIDEFGKDYSCGQAVLDSDWHKQAFPDQPFDSGPLSLLLQAGATLLGNKKLAFASDPRRYAQIWNMAVEACRTGGDARFVATLINLGAK